MAAFPQGSQGPRRIDGWTSPQCPTCPSPGQARTGALPGAKDTSPQPRDAWRLAVRLAVLLGQSEVRLRAVEPHPLQGHSGWGGALCRFPSPSRQKIQGARQASGPAGPCGSRAGRRERFVTLGAETGCEPPLIPPHPFPILPGLPAASAPPDSGAPLGPRRPRRPAIR